jgi:uncharacterized protein
MMRFSRYTFAMLLLTFASYAAPLVNAQSASAIAQDVPELPVRSLLWKITGNGLAKPSYLFGTIHLICENEVVISAATKRAFAETKQLAMEIDMGASMLPSGGAMNDAMNNAMNNDISKLLLSPDKGVLMRGDTSVRDLLDSADYALLTRFVRDSVGIALTLLERFKPLFITTMFLLDDGDGACKQTSYEEAFVRLAKQSKKPTLGIETAEQQLGFFDSIPYKQQAAMLMEDVKERLEPLQQSTVVGKIHASETSMKRITELYKRGDISTLVEEMHITTGENSQFETILLQQRNRAWMPILERIVRQKPTFIAVGAAHLPGKQGVIHLLRQQGYTLSPVQ